MVIRLAKKTYQKNVIREIRSTRSRFFSIFGIVMLGVAMLTGLISVAPDMRAAGNRYFRSSALCDLRIVSTLGLTEDDIAAIRGTDGVDTVMAVRSVETEVRTEAGDTLVMRAQSLPDGADATKEGLNRLRIQEGRLPEKEGECAVQGIGFISGIQLGDKITIPDETEGLSRKEYTVVGVVRSPLNFSIDHETSSAGDGSLDFVAYLRESEFTADYYGICYLTVSGAQELDTYSTAYQDAVGAVSDRLEALGKDRAPQRRADIVADAQAELDDAKQEFETQQQKADTELADAEQKLDDALAKLDRSKRKLDSGEKSYAAGLAELASRRESLPDTLSGSAEELLVSESSVLELEQQLQNLRDAVSLIYAQQTALAYPQAQLQSSQAMLEGLTQAGDTSSTLYLYVQAQQETARQTVASLQAVIAQAQGQLDAAKAALYQKGILTAQDVSNDEMLRQTSAKLQEMELALSRGKLSIATAYGDLEKAEQQLETSRQQLDDGWQSYRDGTAKLETARAEYASQKAQAQQKLADAKQKIQDAQAQIDDIAKAEWYTLDRDAIPCYATFAQNADRIADIARVFPVFFFLVAALVALTTMTRMVEENRPQIGTLKALGYSEMAISAKYLIYALAASLTGAAAGILVGFAGFPSVIWYAYSIMYNVPGFRIIYDLRLILISLALSVAVIAAATLFACHETLREKPAALILPKVPPAGKRILLEYIRPLWNRLSFSRKVTARNLLRYKKRFFMTVLGVAGCTALLLVGFGLRDSIMAIVDDQFTRLNHYDLTINLSGEKALTEEGGLEEILQDSSRIERSEAFYTKSMTIRSADGRESTVTLTMGQDDSAVTEYFTFQTRIGHHAISYGTDSAILTEKTAETLGVKTGDSVWLTREDGSRAEVVITGITENYIYSRLFLTPEWYEKNVGPLPEWNTVLALSTCGGDENACRQLSADILEKNYIATVSFIEEATSAFTHVISSINYVVLLVIFCAGALAAVVLYNLININIAERKKELATIKVLGFFDREVYRYIFREIDILSFFGALAGLAIGVPLHQYIIRTVEIDEMMFIRSIAPASYFYSIALTMLFTFAVNLRMRRHVRRISMVESMKAPE